MSARFGIKGSDVPGWLEHLGVPVPGPNRVIHWSDLERFGSGRCLRQGNTEFLIELESPAPLPQPGEAFPKAWPLIRSDHSCVLQGRTLQRELAQVCSFDFTMLQHEPDLVVMTLLAGIGVTLIREPAANPDEIALRLWCDASYSTYLQECLNTIRGSR